MQVMQAKKLYIWWMLIYDIFMENSCWQINYVLTVLIITFSLTFSRFLYFFISRFLDISDILTARRIKFYIFLYIIHNFSVFC